MKYKLYRTLITISLTSAILSGCKSNYTPPKEIDSKIFDVGKHHICIHIPNKEAASKEFDQYQIEVPDGYEIFDVENFEIIRGKSSKTGGSDYHYINNTIVEVAGTFNEETGIIEYFNFGQPIEKQKVLTK